MSFGATKPRAQPAPPRYGAVTVEVIGLLAATDPGGSTGSDLRRRLVDRFEDQVIVEVANELLERPLLVDPTLRRATTLITELQQHELHELADRLTRLIKLRERHQDYWPDGRLDAGIALAALGRHAEARARLQEAVDLLSGRGLRTPNAQSA
jgi:hypothetical protein